MGADARALWRERATGAAAPFHSAFGVRNFLHGLRCTAGAGKAGKGRDIGGKRGENDPQTDNPEKPKIKPGKECGRKNPEPDQKRGARNGIESESAGLHWKDVLTKGGKTLGKLPNDVGKARGQEFSRQQGAKASFVSSFRLMGKQSKDQSSA